MAATLSVRNYGGLSPLGQVERVPKYFCLSCTRCKDKRCDFFNRRVEPDYNRCFSHTNYIKTPDIHYTNPSEEFFKAIQKAELKRIRIAQGKE